MAASTGYSKVATSGLVFAYDTGDTYNSYKGEPTTNYWNGNQFSIYNDGATNIRNSTDVAPPVPGYEVVKVTANNIGTYGQCILWNSTYPNNNVATITNSIYAYLTVGDYVQVGQHWYPWYYGTQKAIAKNQWVRISETYTINEGNSYGNAALTYSTNGIAYFAMPQYEYKSHVTPFIGANQTRSSTQGLLDLSPTKNIVTLNTSYNSNAQVYFDATDDFIDTNFPSQTISNVTIEAIVYDTRNNSGYRAIVQNNTNSDDALYIYPNNTLGFWPCGGGSLTVPANQWNYVAVTYNGSSFTYYVNGISQTVNSSCTDITDWQFLRIGAYGAGDGERWGGQIPVAKVYNRALSEGEVKQNYNHYKTRYNLA